MAASTVLHLIDTGGPGGAETIFLELVCGLDARRWRSVAVVPEVDWLHGALVARGVAPHVVGSEGAFDLGYLRRLVGLIRRERVALIQTHLHTTAVYGSIAARLTGVPLVATFHGQVDVADAGFLSRVKSRILRRRANRLVFVSEALRGALLPTLGTDERRTHVVHNGIDTDTFRPARDHALRAELGVRDDDVLVGAVGNVRESKDYAGWLEAAALLAQRSARYRFVVVGDTRSPLYGALLAQRTALGLDERVTFTGFRDDVARVFGALDVLALGSRTEGFSLAVVQAMASGVPVVATRCGGPEEILEDGVTGVLVPPRDPAALADAIAALLANDERRGTLVRSGRAAAEARFSLSAMVQGYERVYAEYLGGLAPSPDDAASAAQPRAAGERRGLPVG